MNNLIVLFTKVIKTVNPASEGSAYIPLKQEKQVNFSKLFSLKLRKNWSIS
jgi:hypothetical protein